MILLTGGGGFIGSAILKRLIKTYDDENIVVIDNFFRGELRRLPKSRKVYIESGDVRDFEFLKDVFKKYGPFRLIVHAAWINGTKFFYEIPYEVLETGVLGTINIIKLAKIIEPETFVFISSSEVYQEPPVVPTPEEVRLIVPDVLNPRYSYGGGKITGELLTVNAFRDTRVRWIIVRPHNIYGPDMGFEHVIPELILKIWKLSEKMKIKSNISVKLKGSGEETRSFCYIEDFIQGMELLLDKAESGIYNIGNDQAEVTINSLADMIAKLMNIEVKFFAGKAPEGSTRYRRPDISKIKALGFLPRWDLKNGLKETIDWYLRYLDSTRKEVKK